MTDRPDHHILDAGRHGSALGGPSFSFGHRLYRLVWNLVWAVAAAWTPAPLHFWRVFVLRLFGAQIGRGVRVYGRAEIWYPPNLRMDDNAVMGPGVICYCMATTTLGAGCVVSQRSHLCCGTHDIDDPHFQLVARPITIGPKAWIGAGAFVGPGVTVAEGAVLGAGAVTVKDLASWTVYVGNPAKAVRQRRRH